MDSATPSIHGRACKKVLVTWSTVFFFKPRCPFVVFVQGLFQKIIFTMHNFCVQTKIINEQKIQQKGKLQKSHRDLRRTGSGSRELFVQSQGVVIYTRGLTIYHMRNVIIKPCPWFMLCRVLLFLGINRFTHNPEICPSVPVKSYDFPGNDEATPRLWVN